MKPYIFIHLCTYLPIYILSIYLSTLVSLLMVSLRPSTRSENISSEGFSTDSVPTILLKLNIYENNKIWWKTVLLFIVISPERIERKGWLMNHSVPSTSVCDESNVPVDAESNVPVDAESSVPVDAARNVRQGWVERIGGWTSQHYAGDTNPETQHRTFNVLLLKSRLKSIKLSFKCSRCSFSVLSGWANAIKVWANDI